MHVSRLKKKINTAQFEKGSFKNKSDRKSHATVFLPEGSVKSIVKITVLEISWYNFTRNYISKQ